MIRKSLYFITGILMLLAVIFVPLILQYGIKLVTTYTIGVFASIIWVLLTTMLIVRGLDLIKKDKKG